MVAFVVLLLTLLFVGVVGNVSVCVAADVGGMVLPASVVLAVLAVLAVSAVLQEQPLELLRFQDRVWF